MSYSDPPPPPPQQPPYGGEGGGYGAPPPPGYGGQPYGGAAPGKSGKAIAGLVLGIIGVIPCFWGCFIFSILGVVFGQLGKSDIRASNGMKTGAGQAKWGVILGIVGIALGVVYWILFATGVINFNYTGEMG